MITAEEARKNCQSCGGYNDAYEYYLNSTNQSITKTSLQGFWNYAVIIKCIGTACREYVARRLYYELLDLGYTVEPPVDGPEEDTLLIFIRWNKEEEQS